MKRILSFFVLIMLVLGQSIAQVTTSSLEGHIVDDFGDPIIGASIQAIHTPSGSNYGGITNLDGLFRLQGLRVGGPYHVKISYMGFQGQEFKNIHLQLGESYHLKVKLLESTELLSEVVVMGESKSSASGGTNFKASALSNTPTVSRSVNDIVKLTPQASVSKNGGMSFAGTNNRYNSFQVDGTVSNDVFGLASSGTNGGQADANPISLDAIEEIQVVVAPFDVTQSGFTGGGVNAITKSGTNQFKGSAYGYYTDDNFYGKYNQYAQKTNKLDQQSLKTVGATVGGPLVKDKLFFFVSGEYSYKENPVSYYAGMDNNYISTSTAQQIVDKYKEYTGIQEKFGRVYNERGSLNLMGRLDWNINSKHKMSLRYQLSDAYKDSYSPGSKSFYFENSGYRFNSQTNSVVAELNSNISESLYNELRASMTVVRDSRDVAYSGPNVVIENAANALTANIGTEYSSGANTLDQDIYTIENNLSYYKGKHTFTLGTHNEFYRMKNLFLQASTGAYYFKSVEDFMNDNAYRFVYNYTDQELTGSSTWAPTLNAGQLGFYAQDKWAVTNNFQLTYGVRADIPVFFNAPTENAEFNESSIAKDANVKVGELPKTKILWSPRVGFRWYVDESRKTLVRGGAGLFTGRIPFVWLSNVWNNTGIEQKGTTITTNVPKLGDYANDPQGAMNSAVGTATKPTINTVDRNYKLPQVLRANLALEQKLPGDVKFTLDGVYSKTLNNIWFENLALKDEGTKAYAVEGVEASAVPYFTTTKSDYYTVINLKNTNKGYSYQVSGKLEKSFQFGLDLMASYSFGHSYSVNDGTSSVAYANWKYNYSTNTNKPIMSYSLFDKPHRVQLSASYTTPRYFNGLMATTVGVVYTGSVGQRYSLTMYENTDFNNDTQKSNNLLYIPTAAELEQMNFKTEEDRAKFANWIENDSYAKKHRGQFAERNSNLAPWENHVDLHIAQDIFYLKKRGSKVQLTFDVMNFGNMLNKKWGTYYSSAYNVTPLKLESLQSVDGHKVGSFSFVENAQVNVSDFSSRWNAQVGARVTF